MYEVLLADRPVSRNTCNVVSSACNISCLTRCSCILSYSGSNQRSAYIFLGHNMGHIRGGDNTPRQYRCRHRRSYDGCLDIIFFTPAAGVYIPNMLYHANLSRNNLSSGCRRYSIVSTGRSSSWASRLPCLFFRR